MYHYTLFSYYTLGLAKVQNTNASLYYVFYVNNLYQHNNVEQRVNNGKNISENITLQSGQGK